MLRVRHLVQEFASIRVLLELENFAGWTAGPLWRDLDLDTSHLDSVKKLALVGDKAWQAGMREFCEPFGAAVIRYFDQSRKDSARRWIEE